MTRLAFPLLCLALVSCVDRPETSEYFTEITGLPLCAGSTVRNVNADDPGRSPGSDSIYIVDVTMPLACERNFRSAIERQIGVKCEAQARCSGRAKSGEFYSVAPLRKSVRVTHST